MMLSEETSAVRPQKQTRFNGAKLVWMLKGSPLTVTGAVIIVLMLLMMIFSPWLATHDPNAIDLTARLLPPSAAHWFGTDEVGRDLFSRVLVGSQQSILAGLVVVAIAGMIGSLLGCLSGVLRLPCWKRCKSRMPWKLCRAIRLSFQVVCASG